MDRRRLFRGIAILVAVVAVATAAGGFTSTAGGDGDGERAPGLGAGDGSGVGIGDGDEAGLLPDEDAERLDVPGWIVTVPLTVLLWASTAFLVAFVAHTLWSGRTEDLLAVVRGALTDVLAVVVFFFAIVALLAVLAALAGDGGGGALGGGASTVVAVGGSASGVTVPASSLVAGFAIVLGLLGAAAASIALGREGASGTSTTAGRAGAGDATKGSTGGLVDTSSTAADVEPDNEVYRAWLAMRAGIGEPVADTETPGSIQHCAGAAGLDADAVAELTTLFCAVRYGGAPVTEERERRAVELLDRIDRDGP